MENSYIIKEQDLQITLNYLATKPYNEVSNLINGLQQLQKVKKAESPKVVSK